MEPAATSEKVTGPFHVDEQPGFPHSLSLFYCFPTLQLYLNSFTQPSFLNHLFVMGIKTSYPYAIKDGMLKLQYHDNTRWYSLRTIIGCVS